MNELYCINCNIADPQPAYKEIGGIVCSDCYLTFYIISDLDAAMALGAWEDIRFPTDG